MKEFFSRSRLVFDIFGTLVFHNKMAKRLKNEQCAGKEDCSALKRIKSICSKAPGAKQI